MADQKAKLVGQPPASALTAVKYSYQWENTWRYVVVRPPVKSVGMAIKSFSNKKGLQIHPGVRRLMAITGHTKPTVIDAMAQLRWLGFLWRRSSAQGSNNGYADSYQLCLPRSMEHVPRIDAKTAQEPSFYDLPPIAQQVAVALDVDRRLKKVSGCLSQPGGKARQPLVVVPDNLEWWSQLTPPTQRTHASTKSSHHHADSSESGPRASSRAADDDFEDYDFIEEAVGGFDPAEASMVDGRLAKGEPRQAIINTILRWRREAA